MQNSHNRGGGGDDDDDHNDDDDDGDDDNESHWLDDDDHNDDDDDGDDDNESHWLDDDDHNDDDDDGDDDNESHWLDDDDHNDDDDDGDDDNESHWLDASNLMPSIHILQGHLQRTLMLPWRDVWRTTVYHDSAFLYWRHSWYILGAIVSNYVRRSLLIKAHVMQSDKCIIVLAHFTFANSYLNNRYAIYYTDWYCYRTSISICNK